jgi:hypothetical protein
VTNASITPTIVISKPEEYLDHPDVGAADGIGCEFLRAIRFGWGAQAASLPATFLAHSI